MLVEVEKSHAQGKYVIINDKQGNVATFYNYKGTLVEFNKEVVRAALGAQSKEDCIERLRSSFLCAGRIGSKMLIDCG